MKELKKKIVVIGGGTGIFAVLNGLKNYLGERVLDYVVVNNKKPAPARLRPYASERACLVENDLKKLGPKPILIAADLLRPRGFVRHDPEKTAAVVKKLL